MPLAALQPRDSLIDETDPIFRESTHGEQPVTPRFGPATNVAVQTAWQTASILHEIAAFNEATRERSFNRLKFRPNFHCSDKIVKRSARGSGSFQTIS
ncbi:hypothetical protein QO058_27535 [Bosea vestrisii]|uniref:hypothetical protein n=1 Tax=Bosea vestrisii TaxID=151416 RepID=UPI0024DF90D0|nr:hypothetical protein [Bosea vestrisii]WID96429.1 hypothetical protein QO058_27535 [Bosea vestrisii]